MRHGSSDAGRVRRLGLVNEEGTEPPSVLEGEVGDARIVGVKLLAFGSDGPTSPGGTRYESRFTSINFRLIPSLVLFTAIGNIGRQVCLILFAPPAQYTR